MANRVAAPNLFAPSPPNWSLALLDQNSQSATGAINDSSLGATNGPLADTGSVNAYTVTCTYGSPSAYNNGMTVFFRPANTNTGPSTLTVVPLGSLPIVATDSSALVGGEMVVGTTVGLVCDGTAFRIFSTSTTSVLPIVGAMRLRSFNAVGNPNMEVDQANVGAGVVNPVSTTRLTDRWFIIKAGVMTVNTQQNPIGTTGIIVPGTNFWISRSFLRITLTGQESSLSASDNLGIVQNLEGSQFRELIGDVHSLSLLVRCSSPLQFGVNIRDNPATQCLSSLCTITTANTWTLCQIPNLPVFPSANWSTAAGTVGQTLRITLAAASNLIVTANNVWQAGTTAVGAVGQGNFAGQAVNSTFDIGFVQWEPGPQCTVLMDKPYIANYSECLRYFCKSYDYGTAIGTNTTVGVRVAHVGTNNLFALSNNPFPVPMARTPSVLQIYAPDGTISKVLPLGGSNIASGTLQGVSTTGFCGMGVSGGTTNIPVQYHYYADSGW